MILWEVKNNKPLIKNIVHAADFDTLQKFTKLWVSMMRKESCNIYICNLRYKLF